jgi:hypothetical protein
VPNPLPTLMSLRDLTDLTDAANVMWLLLISEADVVRLLGTLTLAWLALLAMVLGAHVASVVVRARASRHRIAAGVPTFLDVQELMRDKLDETGAPFWPQRHLLANPLVRGEGRAADARLLAAWVSARQPIGRLITFRQAGFSEDQIARHACGAVFIDPTTADTLAALRT